MKMNHKTKIAALSLLAGMTVVSLTACDPTTSSGPTTSHSAPVKTTEVVPAEVTQTPVTKTPSTDEVFWAVMQSRKNETGMNLSTQEKMINLAHTTCGIFTNSKSEGNTYNVTLFAVGTKLSSDENPLMWNASDAGYFIGASIAGYCPENAEKNW